MTDEPDKVELETPDLAAEYRAALAQLFPGVLEDGVLEAGKLGELLDTPVAQMPDARERYGLQWAGKQEAVRSLLTPSRGTLVPDLEESIEFDTAKNVFIEGDSLEVLKLLQKGYNDKIKLIYIDPPYNTGTDFVYNDDFSDGLRGYLSYTGQLDDGGNRKSTSVDKSGRRHSRWLAMMYPRLLLARNLLSQDGYIFVSISDVEVANLRGVLDEVFGEENFVECFVWQSIFRPSNMSKRVRRNAEYVLCYQRAETADAEFIERFEDPKGEASLTQNNNSVRSLTFPRGCLDVKLPDGVYPAGVVGEVELETDLKVNQGRNSTDLRIAGRFKWSQQYLDDEIAKGAYLAIKTSTFIPYYRKDYQQTALRPTKLLPRDLVGDVLQANAELDRIGLGGVFDYPKPTSLVRMLMTLVGVGDGETVLDFFAGSGTTAHAVAIENATDGGQRRVISVNLPEATPEGSEAQKAGFDTVSAITRARLHWVSANVKGAATLGLKVCALDKSNFLAPTEGEELDLSDFTLAWTEKNWDSIAVEVLLKEGVAFDETWVRHKVAGAEVVISDGVAVVLSDKVDNALVEGVLKLATRVVVFLEDGFAGADAVKANAVTNARNAGITLKTV